MTKDETRAAILAILTTGEGMTPDNVADAICSALFPGEAPAAPLNDGSRDETGDSIDPTTGTLTDAARAKRAADQAQADADQADADIADAEEAAAEAEEAQDETALAAAKDKLNAAQARKAAADAKRDGSKAVLAADDADADKAMVETPDGATADGAAVDPAIGNVTTSADLS